MKLYMDRNVRYVLILATIVVVALVAGLWADSTYQPPPFTERFRPPHILSDLEPYYVVKSVVSAVNLALLIFLMIIYIDIYRKTRSEFTIGLMIFSMIFLLTTLASSPFVISTFGLQARGLGPFSMLPDVFTCFALLVLLYLSVKY
jgi:hypothetical protein